MSLLLDEAKEYNGFILTAIGFLARHLSMSKLRFFQIPEDCDPRDTQAMSSVKSSLFL